MGEGAAALVTDPLKFPGQSSRIISKHLKWDLIVYLPVSANMNDSYLLVARAVAELTTDLLSQRL